jgi:hypothetical protein
VATIEKRGKFWRVKIRRQGAPARLLWESVHPQHFPLALMLGMSLGFGLLACNERGASEVARGLLEALDGRRLKRSFLPHWIFPRCRAHTARRNVRSSNSFSESN